MDDDLKTHVSDMNVWKRLLFMLLFGAIYAVTRLVLVAVVVFQLLWVLFTGDRNDKLLSFGSQLAAFIYQIYRYLTFNTESRPFPFSDLPDESELTSHQCDVEPEQPVVGVESETGIEAEGNDSQEDSGKT